MPGVTTDTYVEMFFSDLYSMRRFNSSVLLKVNEDEEVRGEDGEFLEPSYEILSEEQFKNPRFTIENVFNEDPNLVYEKHEFYISDDYHECWNKRAEVMRKYANFLYDKLIEYVKEEKDKVIDEMCDKLFTPHL